MKFFMCQLIGFVTTTHAQYVYEPSNDFPYGRPNPDAPSALQDYKDLIGSCDCFSTRRNPDGTWSDKEPMSWRFKYIMNGTAIQDETLKEGGIHSGSIRQFNSDSSKWYVHYYSNRSASKTLSTWEGGQKADSLVLYRNQKAPNGSDGFYRIVFSNISNQGFNWVGAWVDPTETIVFPTWKIKCRKRLE